MVAIRGQVTNIAPMVDYDYPADVLYISLGGPMSDEGQDTADGIVLRFAVKDNRPSGATIIGFRRNRWDNRLLELSFILGERLGIDPMAVQMALEPATTPPKSKDRTSRSSSGDDSNGR